MLGATTLCATALGREEIRLSVGETKILLFQGLKKIKNLNANVMRVTMDSKIQEISVTALSKGNGKLMIFDELGKHAIEVEVYSKMALDLEREIKELTRDIEGIAVKQVGHNILITGNVLTSEDDFMLKSIAKQYEHILNFTKKMPSANVMKLEKMIQVELKMMELNDQRLKALGIQFPDSLRPHFSLQTERRDGVVSSTFQLSSQFDLIFRALEQKGLAKVLANPKLVCKNGGEAKFLAGGEIPIRLTHGKSLSVQWKPYGILLHIFPTVDSQNHIAVTLTVEISTLNAAQSVDGIPALMTRRVETSFHVGEGETIILSGLIHEESSEDLHKIPALSLIPILGELFQSRQFQNKRSELMVFVTPTVKEASK